MTTTSMEYYIVETMRFFSVILFYDILRDYMELRDILKLKVLKSFSNYEDFRIIKRNVKERADEIYGLDTILVTADLNRLRKGKRR
ncbi:hypothetical protein AIOGIFDO_00709 [Candidatus Methanoperedenaceae archaeon GB37]|nr:hypothetical protein AIOGIFDO_00709 [Candidatus Methanoperedenaceae archaeon GB37]